MLFINSKVKVEINDPAICKSLWLLEKIYWVYYMQESTTLLLRGESLATC